MKKFVAVTAFVALAMPFIAELSVCAVEVPQTQEVTVPQIYLETRNATINIRLMLGRIESGADPEVHMHPKRVFWMLAEEFKRLGSVQDRFWQVFTNENKAAYPGGEEVRERLLQELRDLQRLFPRTGLSIAKRTMSDEDFREVERRFEDMVSQPEHHLLGFGAEERLGFMAAFRKISGSRRRS